MAEKANEGKVYSLALAMMESAKRVLGAQDQDMASAITLARDLLNNGRTSATLVDEIPVQYIPGHKETNEFLREKLGKILVLSRNSQTKRLVRIVLFDKDDPLLKVEQGENARQAFTAYNDAVKLFSTTMDGVEFSLMTLNNLLEKSGIVLGLTIGENGELTNAWIQNSKDPGQPIPESAICREETTTQ